MSIGDETFTGWPKADLHVHLNGAIPPSTLAELVRSNGVALPDGVEVERDCQVLSPVGGVQEYFRPWLITKRLPVGKACLDTMAFTALQSMAADNVEYVELRNSPFNISQLNNISLAESIRWLVEALEAAVERTRVNARLVLSLSRYSCSVESGNALLKAIRQASAERWVVALDLSGDEGQPVDSSLYQVFRAAKSDMGLRVSIHAGELGSIDNVKWAVTECHADRLGHALAASHDPALLEMIRERDVCVEVCLTSNYLTGSVPNLDRHPVLSFIEHDIPFVLCTDNPQVHGQALSREYALFLAISQRLDVLEVMYDRQRRYAFASEVRRCRH